MTQVYSNYGDVFRTIRLQRGFKVTSFEPELSKSALSRFEKGENSLALDKFCQALDKMKLTLTEFEGYAEDFRASKHNEALTQLYPLYYRQDDKALKELADYSRDWSFALAAKALYHELTDGEFLTKAEQSRLAAFLLEVVDWGTYELTILNAVISQFSVGVMRLLLTNLQETAAQHNQIFHFSRRVSQIYVKGIFTLIQEGEEKAARELLVYVEDFTKVDDLFSRALIYYVEGCFGYRFGDKVAGVAQIREAVHIFNLLESEHHADFLREMAQRYLGITEEL